MPASAWISGFGSRFVPRVPFEIRRTGSPRALIFAHHTDDGVRSMRLIADEDAVEEDASKPLQVAFGPGVEGVAEVLEFLEADPFAPRWSIVTRRFHTVFPLEMTLWSTPADTAWDFELTRNPSDEVTPDPDALMYAQGPFSDAEGPDLALLIGEGMRAAGSGTVAGRHGVIAWLDIDYVIDDVAWRQRRQLVPLGGGQVALVTSQSPEVDAEPWAQLAEAVATELVLRETSDDP